MFQYFPGYLPWPTEKTNTLAKWTQNSSTFRAKFLINLLKAWFGNAATKDNDYCFGLLPIRNTTQNDSIYVQFEKAIQGKMKCIYFAVQNPMVSNPNLGNVHRGLRSLDTVIVQDLFVNETAAFWQRPDNPEVSTEGYKTEDIKTEVIFLPACSYLEREGTMTNSMRMIQWRMKAPGARRRLEARLFDSRHGLEKNSRTLCRLERPERSTDSAFDMELSAGTYG